MPKKKSKRKYFSIQFLVKIQTGPPVGHIVMNGLKYDITVSNCRYGIPILEESATEGNTFWTHYFGNLPDRCAFTKMKLGYHKDEEISLC